jgi:putative transcriptional regulator
VKTNLRVLRAEREWSQAELAKRVGVARATIVSIENERYNPGLVIAFRIARGFGKSIEEVFVYELQQPSSGRPPATPEDLAAEPSATLR